MLEVRSRAPDASSCSTSDQGRKISRPLATRTTTPVTGGYVSPSATIRSRTRPNGSPWPSSTGRPMIWLRKSME